MTSRSCYSLNIYPALPPKCSWLLLYSVYAAIQPLLEPILAQKVHKTRINEDLRSLLAFHACISFVQRFHQARRTHAGWRSRARGRVSRSPVPSACTCAPCPILTSVLWSGQSVHGRWLRRPPTGSTSAFHNLCRNEKRVPTRARSALLCSARLCSRALPV